MPGESSRLPKGLAFSQPGQGQPCSCMGFFGARPQRRWLETFRPSRPSDEGDREVCVHECVGGRREEDPRAVMIFPPDDKVQMSRLTAGWSNGQVMSSPLLSSF